MDISFYELGNVYAKDILFKENSKLEDPNVSMSSFTTPGGTTPIAGNLSDIGKKDQPIKFPSSTKDLSTEQKSELLKKFLKEEIDNNENWDESVINSFKELYQALLNYHSDPKNN